MLKSVTEWVYDGLNRRRNAQIGDDWVSFGLSTMECSSVTVGLGYWWWNAHRWRLAWVISDGKLKSVTKCSSAMVAWVIGDRMLIDDGWHGLSTMKCKSATVGFLGYQLQVMMKTAWECLVFRLLGVKWNKREKGSKSVFIVKALAMQYFRR